VVPRRLFGTNLRANMQQDERVRAFVREMGITLFRYPDSVDHGYSWDWDAGGIMMHAGRPMISKLSRYDTAVDLARSVGGELFYTVKIHDTTPQEAARWVAEAKKRGMGGAYWCFGNEPYFKADRHYLDREAYVALVNQLAPAMKQADPAIRLGIAWGGPFIEEHSDKGRDSAVLRGTKQWVDFIDFHFYTGRWEKDKGIDPGRIMAGALLVEQHTGKFREIFRREALEKAEKIEIHYWEWNGPPWPGLGGIQSLATGVFAADAIGEMARHGVKAAIQYNLQEHACGLIPGWEQDRVGSWATEDWNGRTIRPIAWSLQLWSRHMGPVLVDARVSGAGSYNTKDWHTLVNYQGQVPLLNAHATRGADGRSLQVMVINRSDKAAIEASISIAGFAPGAQAQVLSLAGPSALSHNDVTSRTLPYRSYPDAPDPIVKLERSSRAIPGSSFTHTFPPHSVTVLLMEPGPQAWIPEDLHPLALQRLGIAAGSISPRISRPICPVSQR
jgi:hypothetical protein